MTARSRTKARRAARGADKAARIDPGERTARLARIERVRRGRAAARRCSAGTPPVATAVGEIAAASSRCSASVSGFGPSYSTFDIADVSMNAPDGANAPVTRRFPRQHCERRHLVRMLCRATFASVSVGAQARCAGRSTDSILIAGSSALSGYQFAGGSLAGND
jgi:hypothetical protein